MADETNEQTNDQNAQTGAEQTEAEKAVADARNTAEAAKNDAAAAHGRLDRLESLLHTHGIRHSEEKSGEDAAQE